MEKEKRKYLGIKDKTLLRVSAVVAFFIFIFIFVFTSIFSNRLGRENIANSRSQLENLNHNLTSYFDEISAIANEPNYDYDLQNYLKEQRENNGAYNSISSNRIMRNYEVSKQLFGEEINRRTDISSIMIFNEKRVLLYRSIYSFWSTVMNYSQQEWYQKAIESEEGAAVTGPHNHAFLLENKEKQISVSRRISSFEDGSTLGVILVDLNLNKIEEICSAFYPQNEGNLCLISNEGTVVYEQRRPQGQRYNLRQEEIAQSLYQGLTAAGGTAWEWQHDGEKYQIVSYDIEKAGWTAVSITPISVINRSMYETVAVIMLVGFCLLLIIIVILNILLKRIVNPIVSLADAMDMADGGNLGLHVPVKGHDETGRLSKSYNRMLERIDLLMKQVVNEQEEKRKYELQMLQAQINPHFLYNTLDSIIWMAELKDDSVVPMTEALAKLFRISLNKGNEFITIRDELEHVRNYLVIQSMRYEDKFSYSIVAADEVMNYKTVKLIIQPIVENSIYHGIKLKKQKGNIVITVMSRDQDILIRVSDDGAGMSEATCREILTKDSHFENTSGSGIGVKNVNERIRLYFGPDYGLTYESREGKGTTVTIRLPKLNEQEAAE